jgi:hypothetical protein
MIAEAEGRSRDEVEGERIFQGASEFALVVRDLLARPGTQLNGALVLWDRRIVAI